MYDGDDLVGINEIAELAKVSKQAVANWRARWPDFPKPIALLAAGPIFHRSQVIAWMTGRRNLMTDRCPVCLNTAERGRNVYDNDKKEVLCQRCGPFEISGTALAMLSSRVDQDPRMRARLSHAIRSNTSEGNWLFISSANLDELARQPLPGIPQQLQNLTRWLAMQLGDDHLGRVPWPSPESLAGMIGARNGERVERLIDYAVKQGILERDTENEALGLSPEAWTMIETPKKKDEQVPQARPMETPAAIIKAHCNKCSGERNAYKRASHTVNGEEGVLSWSDTYDVLECCGCSSIAVRHTLRFSEWDDYDFDPQTGQPRLIPGIKTTYWPPPTKRSLPEWAENLDDDVLRDVIDEVYQALNFGQIVLASIGTRTLLDRAMYLRIGDHSGGFTAKLGLMVEKGHIGKDERDILETVTDAGSAAAHRGFAPSPKNLGTIIETTENFLQREFILKTAASEVRTATPSRQDQKAKLAKGGTGEGRLS